MAVWPHAERWVAVVRAAPIVLLAATHTWAKLFLTQDQALRKAFPEPIETRRKTLFLTPEQVHQIESVARAQVTSQVISYYEGWQKGVHVGTAYFDTQIVRTMPMTYMALVQPDGTLASVEVLAFHEPEDYLPRPAWLRLFRGKKLDDKLRLRWGIPNVTGASLTCHTMTDGVRRIVATHQIAVQAGGTK